MDLYFVFRQWIIISKELMCILKDFDFVLLLMTETGRVSLFGAEKAQQFS